MKAPSTNLPTESSLDKRRPSHPIVCFFAGLGVGLYTGPIWGFLVTGFTITQAFNTASDGGEVSADMSSHMSMALISMAIGIAVGLCGAVMILISVLFSDYRSKWFYSWSMVLSILWCFAVFPTGLIIGIPILILFTSRRREFEDKKARREREPEE